MAVVTITSPDGSKRVEDGKGKVISSTPAGGGSSKKSAKKRNAEKRATGSSSYKSAKERNAENRATIEAYEQATGMKVQTTTERKAAYAYAAEQKAAKSSGGEGGTVATPTSPPKVPPEGAIKKSSGRIKYKGLTYSEDTFYEMQNKGQKLGVYSAEDRQEREYQSAKGQYEGEFTSTEERKYPVYQDAGGYVYAPIEFYEGDKLEDTGVKPVGTTPISGVHLEGPDIITILPGGGPAADIIEKEAKEAGRTTKREGGKLITRKPGYIVSPPTKIEETPDSLAAPTGSTHFDEGGVYAPIEAFFGETSQEVKITEGPFGSLRLPGEKEIGQIFIVQGGKQAPLPPKSVTYDMYGMEVSREYSLPISSSLLGGGYDDATNRFFTEKDYSTVVGKDGKVKKVYQTEGWAGTEYEDAVLSEKAKLRKAEGEWNTAVDDSFLGGFSDAATGLSKWARGNAFIPDFEVMGMNVSETYVEKQLVSFGKFPKEATKTVGTSLFKFSESYNPAYSPLSARRQAATQMISEDIGMFGAAVGLAAASTYDKARVDPFGTTAGLVLWGGTELLPEVVTFYAYAGAVSGAGKIATEAIGAKSKTTQFTEITGAIDRKGGTEYLGTTYARSTAQSPFGAKVVSRYEGSFEFSSLKQTSKAKFFYEGVSERISGFGQTTGKIATGKKVYPAAGEFFVGPSQTSLLPLTGGKSVVGSVTKGSSLMIYGTDTGVKGSIWSGIMTPRANPINPITNTRMYASAVAPKGYTQFPVVPGVDSATLKAFGSDAYAIAGSSVGYGGRVSGTGISLVYNPFATSRGIPIPKIGSKEMFSPLNTGFSPLPKGSPVLVETPLPSSGGMVFSGGLKTVGTPAGLSSMGQGISTVVQKTAEKAAVQSAAFSVQEGTTKGLAVAAFPSFLATPKPKTGSLSLDIGFSPQKQGTKTLSLQIEKTKSGEKTMFGERFSPIKTTKTIADIFPISKQKPKAGVLLDTGTRQGQDVSIGVTPLTIQSTETKTDTKIEPTIEMGYDFNFETEIDPPVLPFFFNFGESRGKGKGGERTAKQKQQYRPSVLGAGLIPGYSGVSISKAPKLLSGGEIRGVVKKKKKKKGKHNEGFLI
jgi:hypothetical protein